MNASIWFRNLTCMDYGYVDLDGLIHGGSYHVSATVTGKVSEDESVVLDFSKGKKQIKEIIDDNEDGFDHKLLIFSDSNCIVSFKMNNVTVSSPYFFFSGPKNSVRIINTNKNNLSKYMESYICSKLDDTISNVNLEIKSSGFDKFGTYFNYSHGLKNSSSFGCKNACHGHKSFVEVERDFQTQDKIAEYLDDKVMIFKDNVIEETNTYIKVSYDSDRGNFCAIYHKPHKWLIYDTETTIEFMISHVKKVFENELKGKILRISEGLQKGAEVKC